MQCSVLSMCLTWAKVDAVKTAVELGCEWVVTVFDRDVLVVIIIMDWMSRILIPSEKLDRRKILSVITVNSLK